MTRVGDQQHSAVLLENLDHLTHQALAVNHRETLANIVRGSSIDGDYVVKGVGRNADQFGDDDAIFNELSTIEEAFQLQVFGR